MSKEGSAISTEDRESTCDGSDDPQKRCGRHHATGLASITGGYECCCGKPWLMAGRCMTGASEGDPVDPPDRESTYRDRLAEAIGQSMILRTSPHEIADAVLAVPNPYLQSALERLAEANEKIANLSARFTGVKIHALRLRDRITDPETVAVLDELFGALINPPPGDTPEPNLAGGQNDD